MLSEFAEVFTVLKSVFAPDARLLVKADTPTEYTVVTKVPSPFPQHKGEPMFFGSVRIGKAYVSFHLMPVYMCPELTNGISPELKKRMQGKSCFNFKTQPATEILTELQSMTQAGVRIWKEKKWL